MPERGLYQADSSDTADHWPGVSRVVTAICNNPDVAFLQCDPPINGR